MADHTAFERFWHQHVHRVFAYAQRHVGIDACDDVVVATFTTAWTKWREVPDPALPWLLTVARGHVRNHHRGVRRQQTLAERMALLDAAAHAGADVDPTTRVRALQLLAELADADREALLLVAWDGLSTEEAAVVLQCSAGALRTRLHRARKRLGELDGGAAPASPPGAGTRRSP